jgi:hypothetical protein
MTLDRSLGRVPGQAGGELDGIGMGGHGGRGSPEGPGDPGMPPEGPDGFVKCPEKPRPSRACG